MTPEERFERMESVIAAGGDAAMTRLAEESRAADRRLEEKIDRLADQDCHLGERIDSLVSAIGEFIRKPKD